jgi:hypothetical protein
MEDVKIDQRAIKKEKTKSFRVVCSEKMVGSVYDHRNEVRIPAHGNGDVKIMGEVPTAGWLAMQIESGLVMVIEE